MKRYSLAILFLSLFAQVGRAAPNITVSGNSVTILGSAQTISLTCTLIDPNQTGNLRSGSNIITVFVTSTVTPGSVATCGPIYGNDVITDAFGNANTTYYKVQVFTVKSGIIASTPSLQAFYAFQGSGTVDLSTATPVAPTFLTGPTGSVSIPGSLTVTGALNATGTTNISNLNHKKTWDGTTYPITDAGFRQMFTDCIADSACSIVDAESQAGASITLTASVTITKSMKVRLGSNQTIALAANQILVQADGITIEGVSQGQSGTGTGSTFTYSGTAQAVLVKSSSANTAIYGTILRDFRVQAIGAAISSASAQGMLLNGSRYGRVDNVKIQDFQATTSYAFDSEANGTAFSASNEFNNNIVSTCLTCGQTGGSSASTADNFIGGFYGSMGGAGSVSLNIGASANTTQVWGGDFESAAIGIQVAGSSTSLHAVRLEFVTGTYIKVLAGADRTFIVGPRFFTPSGSPVEVSDAGNNTFWLKANPLSTTSSPLSQFRLVATAAPNLPMGELIGNGGGVEFQLNNQGASGCTWGLSSSTNGLFQLFGRGGLGGGCTTNTSIFNLNNANMGIPGPIQNLAGSATMGLTLKKGSGAGNYTNATTTYAVADSTNLCFTVTIPTGWKLGVNASGILGTATAAVVANVALTDNAACSTANAGLLTESTVTTTAAAVLNPFSLNWIITGDGASHNVALQFKTSNAADSATLGNSSATLLPTMAFTLMPSN